MKRALYAGSFDPFTSGHESILKVALGLFDHVTILIAHNPNKKGWLTPSERQELIQRIVENPFFKGYVLKREPRVSVDTCSGLVARYAVEHSIGYSVRGLRVQGDFEAEYQMAAVNSSLAKKYGSSLQTVFFPAQMEHINSSLVRELWSHGESVGHLLPANGEAELIRTQILKDLGDNLRPQNLQAVLTAYKTRDEAGWYHGWQHITQMYSAFRGVWCQYRFGQQIPSWLAAAIVYHDAVYNPSQPGINEQKSAELLSRDSWEHVLKRSLQQALILATDHQAQSRDQLITECGNCREAVCEALWVLDADLSVLGTSRSHYAFEYLKALHREYTTQFTPEQFSAGRKAWVEQLLTNHKDTPIFHTPEFQQVYEDKARKNLEWELAQWQREDSWLSQV